jgi:hypothetical protein
MGGRGRVKKGRWGGGKGRGGGRLGISEIWSLLARRELNRKTSVSFSITGDKQKIGDSKQQKQQQHRVETASAATVAAFSATAAADAYEATAEAAEAAETIAAAAETIAAAAETASAT